MMSACRVERLNVHGYIRSDPPDVYEPALELAHTDFIAHAHFQNLASLTLGEGGQEDCRALHPLEETLEWWKADPEFARHVKRLRDGRCCQFQGPEQGVSGGRGGGSVGGGGGVTSCGWMGGRSAPGWGEGRRVLRMCE